MEGMSRDVLARQYPLTTIDGAISDWRGRLIF